MFKRDDPRKVATIECQRLAEIVGLANGELRITVSEAQAVKIEIRQDVRVCCVRRKENEWDAPDEHLELVMDEAPRFVMDHLEDLIVSLVGRFGYLMAVIEEGSVTHLVINIFIRSPRRPPARRSITAKR